MRGIATKLAAVILLSATCFAQIVLQPANGGTGKSGSSIVHNIASALACNDTSGSGTAQSCNTSPTYTPAAGDWIIYSTTTPNSGDLTIAVNGGSAAHVHKWLSGVLASGDVPANKPIPFYFDGTYWNAVTIGNAPSFSQSWPSGSPGVPNYNGSNAWGPTYNSSNLLPNNFLPNGWINSWFATVGTTAQYASTHYAGTLPANLSGATATCSANPAGSIVFTIAVIHSGASTNVGTVTLNTSCAATLATTGGTTQTFAADDRISIAPGGADASAANVVLDIPYTRN